MKKLDLIFLSTAKHATHHMQFNFVDTDLDTEKVKQAMQQLADLKLFVDKDKHPLYEVPMGARSVTTTDHVLFDNKPAK